jgi:hypothetical protein
MRFLRLGFIAAMATALCGQQALAADAPPAKPKFDQKVADQSMKDAPALVQAAGLKCNVTGAYQIGFNNETINGKKVTATFYELACGQGDLGYIFKSVQGGESQSYDCLSLKVTADRNIASGAKPGPTCGMLPANADPAQNLKPMLAEAGVDCQPTKATWDGGSPNDKIDVYEAACANGGGYLIVHPQPGSTKTLEAIPCVKSDLVGVKCTLTSEADISKQIIALSAGANRPKCMPNKARWVVSDPSNGNDFYEIGCSDGQSAYMLQTTSKGAFRAVIECSLATRIAGGCQYMNAASGSTTDNATYTKLAKQIGYDACPAVQKYQSYGTENGGQREIVELNCSATEGSFAIVPTGAGQSGEYFNCVRASGRGLTCHLTSMDATYAKISQQIAARGKTTCKVSNGRSIGKDASGAEYVDVACSPGDPQPEMILQYSKVPQETLAQATTCAQSPVGAGECKLAGAGATAKK